MSTDDQIPELVRLIFGEQAPTAYALGGERLQAWAAAFDAWIAGIEARNPRKARHRYRWAWSGFLAFCHKAPWEVDRRDLQAWTDDLVRSGYPACTVKTKLSSLSSFYIYAEKVLDPALVVANPLKGFRKPSYDRDARIVYLSAEEARRLLEAVDRETSLLGKRDYALLPGQPRELLRLRWSGLVIAEAGACLAGDPPVPLLLLNWEAIRDYLSASGRLAVIQPC